MEIWLIVMINGVNVNGSIMSVQVFNNLQKENGIAKIVSQTKKKIIKKLDLSIKLKYLYLSLFFILILQNFHLFYIKLNDKELI